MENIVSSIISIGFIAVAIAAAFALMITVGRISNFLIRRILGIGGN